MRFTGLGSSYGVYPSDPNRTGFCTSSCETSNECDGGGGLCWAAEEDAPPACVYQWADGFDPDSVKRQGIVALVFYIALGFAIATGTAMQLYSFSIVGERLTRRLRALVFRSLVRQSSARTRSICYGRTHHRSGATIQTPTAALTRRLKYQNRLARGDREKDAQEKITAV